MRRYTFFALLIAAVAMVQAQDTDTLENLYTNTAQNMLLNDHKLVIGGYGEVHYNQPLDADFYKNGSLDVHRMVMLFGYNFNSKTSFVTELEFEHVKEIYVEQAFLQHKINNYISFRGGLLLVPMGIINEYHEPTTFNGVERPILDKLIAPTTWREIGFGFTGTVLPASLRYQAYILNGFNGYSGSAKFNGKNGLRSGRQKGAESFMSTPNFSGKVEYFGLRGLNIGLSLYAGQSQSTLYDGVAKDDDDAVATADSSTIGMVMTGIDARYSLSGLQLRGQFYYTSLSDVNAYNTFTATAGSPNDLGSAMTGYYAEAGYNVLRTFASEMQLVPFVRYEFLDTHHKVEGDVSENPAYEITAITTGLSLHLTKGAVIKTDLQFMKNAATEEYNTTFNAGVGVMF